MIDGTLLQRLPGPNQPVAWGMFVPSRTAIITLHVGHHIETECRVRGVLVERPGGMFIKNEAGDLYAIAMFEFNRIRLLDAVEADGSTTDGNVTDDVEPPPVVLGHLHDPRKTWSGESLLGRFFDEGG